MARVAFIFPGQGSQSVGMGKDLAAAHPAAAAVYDLADSVLGFSLRQVCWQGPVEKLTQTVYTQPAIVTTSLACLAVVTEAGIKADIVAGHSVGEYPALVAAGVLSVADAIRLSYRRGQLMDEAGQERPGAMSAVLNMDHDALEEVCKEVTATGIGTVVVANFNTASQLIISGDVKAVEKAEELAKARGARRIMRLPVGGAFHSPLMEPAVRGLSEALDSVTFQDARIPMLTSTVVEEVRSGARLRDLMKAQVVSQVQWEPATRVLLSVPTIPVEIGSGNALSGIVKKISRDTEILRVGDPASLAATLGALPRHTAHV